MNPGSRFTRKRFRLTVAAESALAAKRNWGSTGTPCTSQASLSLKVLEARLGAAHRKSGYDWNALPEGRYFVEWWQLGKRKREARARQRPTPSKLPGAGDISSKDGRSGSGKIPTRRFPRRRSMLL
jgi:hypothetical protein